MSNTTVTTRSTAHDARVEELRRIEAQAREAARRRLNLANAQVAELEERFGREVVCLDEASSRLPDLVFEAPRLAGLDAAAANDPARAEAYAMQLAGQVDRFSRQLAAAVDEAERRLARRIRKAAAWEGIADLEPLLNLALARCGEDAARLHEPALDVQMPQRPTTQAELEVVEAHLQNLQRLQDQVHRHRLGLNARLASNEAAQRLAGPAVSTATADETLARHEAGLVQRSREELNSGLHRVLADYQLGLDDLPAGLRGMIDFAIERADVGAGSGSIERWIAQEKRWRDATSRARALLQSPPELVHADPRMSGRWMDLAERLQRVAGRIDDFVPSLELEYEQLRGDAQRQLNTALTRADWIRALNAEGFEVLERDDGEGLVVVDLEHPQTWLEATPLEMEGGGFGAVLDLKTDSDRIADEAGVIRAICGKLERVARSAAPVVESHAEVASYVARIDRGRRPKAMSQRME